MKWGEKVNEFLTIKQPTTAQITEKKSRFIANIIPVESKEEAENIIKQIKKENYDARHHCSAVLEDGKLLEKSNDDGEPSGTAGAPMLTLLQKNELCNIVAVVTRYFGGILLGTGGLVRAYSDATTKAIEASQKIEKVIGIQLKATITYSEYEKFKYYCQKNGIIIENESYEENIVCNIIIEETKMEKILADFDTKNIKIEQENEFNKRFIEKSIIKWHFHKQNWKKFTIFLQTFENLIIMQIVNKQKKILGGGIWKKKLLC